MKKKKYEFVIRVNGHYLSSFSKKEKAIKKAEIYGTNYGGKITVTKSLLVYEEEYN